MSVPWHITTPTALRGKAYTLTDIGTQMLDHLYDKLMIDGQWSVRRERGFTWWGYRLAQHIEVSTPVRSHDRDFCIVRIWTDLVRHVDPAADPAQLLAMVNMQSTMNALVWEPATATITECCTAVVHEENAGWLWKILMTAAVLQNTAAHSRAHAIAEACNGTPAASNHPTSGERPKLDDMLNFPEHVIVPLGAEESRFTGALAEGLGKFAREMGWVGTSDETGSSARCPTPVVDRLLCRIRNHRIPST